MSTRSVSVSIPLPGPAGVRWLAVGLAAGLLAASIASPAFSPRSLLAADPGTTPEHTISVSGTGRVILSPDTADLRLGVSATAKTVKDARAAAAKSMTAVLAGLKKLGIADKDIQTANLSLQPMYDYGTSNKPPRLTGYQLSNSILVTVRDLDKVSDAIDGALADGATTLDGISFRVADQAAAEKKAREAAMADAKAKAQTLASAAGVSITGVASISETVAQPPYPIYYGAMDRAGALAAIPTPVQAGTSEVSITVAVVYLIG